MSQRSEDLTSGGPRPARIGWHPLDAVSLVAGLLAVGVALVHLLELHLDGGVVVPVVLIAAGLLGLLGVRRRGREDGAG